MIFFYFFNFCPSQNNYFAYHYQANAICLVQIHLNQSVASSSNGPITVLVLNMSNSVLMHQVDQALCWFRVHLIQDVAPISL